MKHNSLSTKYQFHFPVIIGTTEYYCRRVNVWLFDTGWSLLPFVILFVVVKTVAPSLHSCLVFVVKNIFI